MKTLWTLIVVIMFLSGLFFGGWTVMLCYQSGFKNPVDTFMAFFILCTCGKWFADQIET